jgi:hypothetical protein
MAHDLTAQHMWPNLSSYKADLSLNSGCDTCSRTANSGATKLHCRSHPLGSGQLGCGCQGVRLLFYVAAATSIAAS